MTEYSGMKFAVFFLANYMTNLAICAVAAGIFLGGGAGPGSSIPVIGTLLSIVYFLIKTIGLFFVMVWIRGTFPRLRVDQLMTFAWKFLLPLALVNIFSTSLWIGITRWGTEQGFWFVDGLNYPVRLVIAYLVTGAINLGAFFFVVRLNTRRQTATYRPSPSTV
jgi:NADH-quinone oxidoreductase subunit H